MGKGERHLGTWVCWLACCPRLVPYLSTLPHNLSTGSKAKLELQLKAREWAGG